MERNEQYIKTNLYSEMNNTLTQICVRNEQCVKTNMWSDMNNTLKTNMWAK